MAFTSGMSTVYVVWSRTIKLQYCWKFCTFKSRLQLASTLILSLYIIFEIFEITPNIYDETWVFRLLLSSDTAYQAQSCSVVLHVVESADKTIM